jgi:hypothetical protein
MISMSKIRIEKIDRKKKILLRRMKRNRRISGGSTGVTEVRNNKKIRSLICESDLFTFKIDL